jgi:hypothetical protein
MLCNCKHLDFADDTVYSVYHIINRFVYISLNSENHATRAVTATVAATRVEVTAGG